MHPPILLCQIYLLPLVRYSLTVLPPKFQQKSAKVHVLDYDEEADDRDRFKYDKFYNAVVMFGSPVVLAILFYVTYLGHQMERHFDQEKYVNYPYLTVRNKVS